MLQAYQGYFQNGRFISLEAPVTIPENVEVYVMVTDRQLSSKTVRETLTPTQIIAQNFLEAMQTLRKDGFSEEDDAAIADLQSGKYKPVFDRRIES
jgi:hypothetical protein